MKAETHFLVVATEWTSAHGGLSTFNRLLCTHLAAADGVRVTCLVLDASDADRKDAAEKGVTLVEAPRPPVEKPIERLSRRPDLESVGDPDVIIGHARITGPAAQSLNEHFRDAVRVHFIHMIPDDIERYKVDESDDEVALALVEELAQERQKIELELSATADHAVAVGPKIYSWFLRELQALGAEERLLRFDPGFETEVTGPRTPPKGDPWTVLLFGRAEDERLKGLDIAAAGFSRADRNLRGVGLPEIELLIRGARKGKAAELARRAPEWAQDAALNVRVKPYSTESALLSAELRAASLVVMPSRAEGFGLVGQEAIVARAPTLVSSTSGLGRLLKEEAPEFAPQAVVETTNDVEATVERWSRAIESLLRSRKGAFAQAAELQECLAEKFTWSRSVAEFLTALDLPPAPAGGAEVPAPATPLVPATPPVYEKATEERALDHPSIPPRARDFVGREELLTRIGQALADASPDPLVLYGPGGVGKSSVAVEYLHRSAGDHDLVRVLAAENPELIPSQLAALGVDLGLAAATADAETTAKATVAALRDRPRWLLVFDNVEKPDDLRPWLPGGGGNVLVTSRAGGWRGRAQQIPVEEFDRSESRDLLTRNVPGLADGDADELADTLGDLPLALAQAASILDTGVSVAEIQDLISEQAAYALDVGDTRSHHGSLAAVTLIAAGKLAETDPQAATLLKLCCYLAPESVPTRWLQVAAGEGEPESAAGPGPLPRGPIRVGQAFARIRDIGLGRLDLNGLRLHRLTQAIVRDHTRTEEEGYRALAANLLCAVAPPDTDDAEHWPEWKRLTAHLLAIDPQESDLPAVRNLACETAHYLVVSGQTKAALTLTERLHRDWTARLGPDHPDTLTAAQHYAHAIQEAGDYTASLNINQDSFDRRRRVSGEEHPDTLTSAAALATSLHAVGRIPEALRLAQETYDRRRRVLGEEHPDTLTSAGGLERVMHAAGQDWGSLSLARETYERVRRVLGDDHPNTLLSASSLAGSLFAVGQVREALPLARDSYERSRRVLGEEHPDVLISASTLVSSLYAAGQVREALPLAQETYERCRRVLGEEHPDALTAASTLVTSLYAAGQVREALPLAQETYERCRRILGEEHPSTLTTARIVAGALNTVRGGGAALPLARQTHALCLRVLGEDHPNTIGSASALATCLYEEGRVKKALPLAQETFERSKRVLGEEHPETLGAASIVVGSLYLTGRIKKALPLAEQTYENSRRVLGEDNFITLGAAGSYAASLIQTGQARRALPLARDTHERSIRILGPQHPNTAAVAMILASALRATGKLQAAQAIQVKIPKRHAAGRRPKR